MQRFFPPPRLWQRWLLAACLILPATPGILTAQFTPPVDDLTALSLEELGSLNISAASKRSQRVFETPAAVSVILPEDMRRFGHASAAEALRMVPGVHVTRNNTDRWTVGVRGFNGITSTKLLVLVDGRTVYSPYYAGVSWEQADLALDDLARVEVVRGPGATLWGANAVNGIINLVARDARETQGGTFSVRDGSRESLDVYLRQGFQVGEHSWWRVYGRVEDTPRSVGPDPGLGEESVEKHRAGFRGDFEVGEFTHLTLQGEYLDSLSSSEGIDLATMLPTESTETLDHAFLLSRLHWRESADRELMVQLYADYRDSSAIASNRGLGALAAGVSEDGNSVDLDFTHHLKFSERHDLIWGGGVRRSVIEVEVDDTLMVQQPRLSQVLVNFFAQDEISVVPDRLRVTLGTKLEHHETVGWQVLPSARVTFLASPGQTLWAAVSRAVRTPSQAERDSRLNVGFIPGSPMSPPVLIQYVGNSGFAEEKLLATEIGWRWQPTPRLLFESTAYFHRYTDLRDFEPVTRFQPNPPLVLQELVLLNRRAADGYGVEASFDWRIHDGWHVAGTLALATLKDSGAPSPVRLLQADLAEPREMWSLRSWWELPYDFELSLAGYGVGDMPTVDVPGYFRADAQITWRPRLDLEFSLGVQNALDKAHSEYIPILGGARPEVRRNVFGRVKWSF
jgi:iron complex outermembrane recepter protein